MLRDKTREKVFTVVSTGIFNEANNSRCNILIAKHAVCLAPSAFVFSYSAVISCFSVFYTTSPQGGRWANCTFAQYLMLNDSKQPNKLQRVLTCLSLCLPAVHCEEWQTGYGSVLPVGHWHEPECDDFQSPRADPALQQ